jgi:hypothetical protein
MKKIALITLFLTSTYVLAQKDKRIFQPEFQSFVLQCNNIGQTIIDKNESVELNNWYEGIDAEKIKTEIQKLESDIDKSDLEATYYLVMMNEEPLIYSFHFYNKETKVEFGQLFIRFKNRENNLVDDIKVINKEQMELINKEVEEQPLPTNIPPPPPPPIEKKKNGN